MQRGCDLSKATHPVSGRARGQLSLPDSLPHSWWGLETRPASGRWTESLSPDSADAARGQCPGHDLRALLHESPDGEPEAVAQCVLVLQNVGACPQARVWVIPLVGAQPAERQGQGNEAKAGEKGEKQKKNRVTVVRRDRGETGNGDRER